MPFWGLFPPYFLYALMDHQQFVASAAWDKNELISLSGQKVKGRRDQILKRYHFWG